MGFTHICGTSRKTGYFNVQRTTIGRRMAAKLKDIKVKLRQRMHESIAGTAAMARPVVRGYFQYHAIPGNEATLKSFRQEACCEYGLRLLGRRSQRKPLDLATLPSAPPGSCCLRSMFCIRTLTRVLTPSIPEVGTVCANSASTGLCEVPRNRHPYRDRDSGRGGRGND